MNPPYLFRSLGVVFPGSIPKRFYLHRTLKSLDRRHLKETKKAENALYNTSATLDHHVCHQSRGRCFSRALVLLHLHSECGRQDPCR